MQPGSKLLCVSDLLLLGKATIDESRSLLHWLEAEAGISKTGICGLSMGKKPGVEVDHRGKGVLSTSYKLNFFQLCPLNIFLLQK